MFALKPRALPLRKPLVLHHQWLFIEAVCQLVAETIANPLPQLYEGLISFDVDVRLLRKEAGHNADVDVRLTLPHQDNGLRSELV
jgi:HEAT repeat protein